MKYLVRLPKVFFPRHCRTFVPTWLHDTWGIRYVSLIARNVWLTTQHYRIYVCRAVGWMHCVDSTKSNFITRRNSARWCAMLGRYCTR